MNSLLAKWKRDQGGGLPLSFRMELALRYLMDLTYARVYLLGKRLKIGRMPRIRKKPLIKNHGRLLIGHNFFLNSQFASSHIVVLPGGEIVIGEGGRTIKSIGSAARKDIIEAAETNIHLFLFVKVRENWGDDPERYREMGLEFPRK